MPLFNQKNLKKVHQFLISERYDEAIEMMSTWSPVAINLLQEKFTDSIEILRRSEFNIFWANLREKLGIKDKPGFRFQQQRLLSDADFVSGYTYYLLALQCKSTDPVKYQDYFQNALQYHSFHAASMLLTQVLTASRTDRRAHCDNLARVLQALEPVVKVHRAPGFLLMAKGYFQLALVSRNDDDDARDHVGFDFMYKFLYMAKKLEDESTPAIHNAYFGEGLSRSNPFEVESIQEMLQLCIERSEGGLIIGKLRFLEMEANKEISKQTCPDMADKTKSVNGL